MRGLKATTTLGPSLPRLLLLLPPVAKALWRGGGKVAAPRSSRRVFPAAFGASRSCASGGRACASPARSPGGTFAGCASSGPTCGRPAPPAVARAAGSSCSCSRSLISISGMAIFTGQAGLAGAAQARGVRQVMVRGQAVVERREHGADRAGIDAAVGVAADVAIDRAGVQARAAANAEQAFAQAGRRESASGRCRESPGEILPARRARLRGAGR